MECLAAPSERLSFVGASYAGRCVRPRGWIERPWACGAEALSGGGWIAIRRPTVRKVRVPMGHPEVFVLGVRRGRRLTSGSWQQAHISEARCGAPGLCETSAQCAGRAQHTGAQQKEAGGLRGSCH
jgi:hypothetical protein